MIYASTSPTGQANAITASPNYAVLSDVCELLPDGFVALDHQWRIVYLNQRALHMLCRLQNEQEGVEGQNFWQTFPELANSTFQQECERSQQQETEVRFEQLYLTGGILIEVRARPTTDGIYIYLRDVTSRKQAEAALLEQSRLSALTATVSTMLGQQGSLSEMLEQLAQVIIQALPEVALFRVWLWNGEQHLLELKATAGEGDQAIELPKRISLGISIIGLIAQTRQPYFTNNLAHDLCLGSPEWIHTEHLLAFAGYPLIVAEKLVGVIAIFSRQMISEATRSMFQWIVNGTAVAVDRALARAELLSRRESLLFRLANDIRNSLDLDKILNVAVHEIRHLLQIDRCHFIWCWANPGAGDSQTPMQPVLCITHEANGSELTSLLGECPPEQTAVLAHKILNLESIQVEDISATPELDPAIANLMQQWGMKSQLLMPLETRSGHLGAI
ncbi:MAG TPA: GAF domain-containing protein, partial [Allocoleopsis sp.]